jgi:hypothetical protein
MAKKKAIPEYIITELIPVRSKWGKTFIGSMLKETDRDGNIVFLGQVKIKEDMVWSMSSNEEELRKNLDDVCTLKLDYNLHSHPGITIKIFGEDFFLN